MGTTLTGTTPQDTYDSLIKVTDNGPLSGTAKLLTDGLGNDSVLYLGTAGLGIKATSVLSFNVNDATHSIGYDSVIDGSQLRGQNGVRFSTGSGGGTERMRITSAGNVLISATAPVGSRNELRLGGNAGGSAITMGRSGTNVFTIQNDSSDNVYLENSANTFMSFSTNNLERMRILAGGGLTFNGDTAAANALDDYEEGTWTMGIAFGGASVGVTYLFQEASYTKIGRQVTATGVIVLSSKGSSSGNVAITGLPFTIPNSLNRFCAATLRCIGVSFANQFQGEGVINSTTVELNETTEAGVGSALTEADIANNANIALTITYFV